MANNPGFVGVDGDNYLYDIGGKIVPVPKGTPGLADFDPPAPVAAPVSQAESLPGVEPAPMPEPPPPEPEVPPVEQLYNLGKQAYDAVLAPPQSEPAAPEPGLAPDLETAESVRISGNTYQVPDKAPQPVDQREQAYEMRQYANAVRGAAIQKAAEAGQQQIDAEEQLQTAQSFWDRGTLAMEAKANRERDQNLAKSQQRIRELQERAPAVQRAWSGFAGILNTIAAGIGGYLSPYTGGKNMAFEQINAFVEQQAQADAAQLASAENEYDRRWTEEERKTSELLKQRARGWQAVANGFSAEIKKYKSTYNQARMLEAQAQAFEEAAKAAQAAGQFDEELIYRYTALQVDVGKASLAFAMKNRKGLGNGRSAQGLHPDLSPTAVVADPQSRTEFYQLKRFQEVKGEEAKQLRNMVSTYGSVATLARSLLDHSEAAGTQYGGWFKNLKQYRQSTDPKQRAEAARALASFIHERMVNVITGAAVTGAQDERIKNFTGEQGVETITRYGPEAALQQLMFIASTELNSKLYAAGFRAPDGSEPDVSRAYDLGKVSGPPEVSTGGEVVNQLQSFSPIHSPDSNSALGFEQMVKELERNKTNLAPPQMAKGINAAAKAVGEYVVLASEAKNPDDRAEKTAAAKRAWATLDGLLKFYRSKESAGKEKLAKSQAFTEQGDEAYPLSGLVKEGFDVGTREHEIRKYLAADKEVQRNIRVAKKAVEVLEKLNAKQQKAEQEATAIDRQAATDEAEHKLIKLIKGEGK